MRLKMREKCAFSLLLLWLLTTYIPGNCENKDRYSTFYSIFYSFINLHHEIKPTNSKFTNLLHTLKTLKVK